MKKIIDVQHTLSQLEKISKTNLIDLKGGGCFDDKRRQRPGGGTTTTSPNGILGRFVFGKSYTCYR